MYINLKMKLIVKIPIKGSFLSNGKNELKHIIVTLLRYSLEKSLIPKFLETNNVVLKPFAEKAFAKGNVLPQRFPS